MKSAKTKLSTRTFFQCTKPVASIFLLTVQRHDSKARTEIKNVRRESLSLLFFMVHARTATSPNKYDFHLDLNFFRINPTKKKHLKSRKLVAVVVVCIKLQDTYPFIPPYSLSTPLGNSTCYILV